ncbi:MAG: NUDIX hydrolase [SAR86 cluster bacterium]
MAWPPHITVATIVKDADRYLMVEEWVAGELVLNQPAGHLEPNETLHAAALRETLEETAWQVQLISLTGIYHYYAANVDIVYQRLTFAATPLYLTSAPLDADIHSVQWLTLDTIRQRRLRSPLVLQCIEDHEAGQSAPLDFIKHLNA